MPLNFAESRKWLLIALLASITFISPLASSMFAPGVSFMDATFHNTSTILSSLTVSIFVLGYVIGPLILAPLSEIYGRRFVLTGANVFFCVWQIGCALAPNLSALIVFRFLAGIGGSGCLTIGGGVIADLFNADRRGLATAVYSMGKPNSHTKRLHLLCKLRSRKPLFQEPKKRVLQYVGSWLLRQLPSSSAT